MAGYDLPTAAVIGSEEYAIRSDYRPILDIMQVISDPELTDGERTRLALAIFYPDAETIPRNRVQEAIDYLLWFVSGGGE